MFIEMENRNADRNESKRNNEDENGAEIIGTERNGLERNGVNGNMENKKPVEEKDIENVLKILEDFSASETSRLKIQVSEEETPGKAQKAYHYGRCDVGSPWARGECYDLPEQE